MCSFRTAVAVSAVLLAMGPAARPVPAAKHRGIEPVFARGGIALPLSTPEAHAFAVNGKRVPAVPLPGGGWWLSTKWRPRHEIVLRWKESGRLRTERLLSPLRPAAWVWHRLSWPAPGGGSLGEIQGITALAFSPDGALLAVGGGGGRTRVFRSASGAAVWRHHRPGRIIKHLAFSTDGRRLFVGEQGPEGRLAAYDLDGPGDRPRWVLDTAKELGAPSRAAPDDPFAWVRRPGAFRLVAMEGDVIAAYTHSRGGGGGRGAAARLYRLRGEDGTLRWAYPASAPAPMMVTWFAISREGRRFALPLQLPTGGTGGGARVVILAGGTGRVTFEHAIPPLPPYAITTFWRGVALSPAGDRMAASTQDGRGYLFAEQQGSWRLTRRLELVTPLKLGSTTVAATNGTLAATEREALFITGPSFVPLPFRGGDARPTASHPRGNTVFAYDWEGNLRWVRRLDNDLQGLALAGGGGLLALAQGKESPQGAGEFNGVTVLGLNGGERGRGELLYRFPLRGRAVYGGVAVSRDGKWIALAEAPRALRGDARTKGGHGVVLLR
jgi:hypothetical protein